MIAALMKDALDVTPIVGTKPIVEFGVLIDFKDSIKATFP
jgi:hypothetical protein